MSDGVNGEWEGGLVTAWAVVAGLGCWVGGLACAIGDVAKANAIGGVGDGDEERGVGAVDVVVKPAVLGVVPFEANKLTFDECPGVGKNEAEVFGAIAVVD